MQSFTRCDNNLTNNDFQDGVRISGSTLVEHLLESEQFRLRINDTYYDVSAPSFESIAFETVGVTEEILKSTERLTSLNDLRSRVAALYAVLHVDEYKLERENMLIKKLEEVELELKPMIIVRINKSKIKFYENFLGKRHD